MGQEGELLLCILGIRRLYPSPTLKSIRIIKRLVENQSRSWQLDSQHLGQEQECYHGCGCHLDGLQKETCTQSRRMATLFREESFGRVMNGRHVNVAIISCLSERVNNNRSREDNMREIYKLYLASTFICLSGCILCNA